MQRFIQILTLATLSILHAQAIDLGNPDDWIAQNVAEFPLFSENSVSFAGDGRLTFARQLPAIFRMTVWMQTLQQGENPWNTAGVILGLDGSGELNLFFNNYSALNVIEQKDRQKKWHLTRKGVAQPSSPNRLDIFYDQGELHILVNERIHETVENVSLNGRLSLLSNRNTVKFSNIEVTNLSKRPSTLQLGSPFTDHMVLQRDCPIRIWGSNDKNTRITVSFAGEDYYTNSQNGSWKVQIPPHEAGGPYELSVTSEGETLKLSDILIGEVWICAGQSNMEWRVEQSASSQEAIERTPDLGLRLLKVPHYYERQAQSSTPMLQWHRDNPEERARMSAIGYYYGRKLREELGIPIGIVTLAVGGSRAESWLSEQALRRLAEHEGYKYDSSYRSLLSHDEAHKNMPHALYNGMVKPIGGLANAGFLWYQGESNGHRGWFYKSLLQSLIQDWRSLWDNSETPFYIVQLHPFENERLRELGPVWAELREAQTQVAEQDPRSEMVCVIDLGEPGNIHPPSKKPIAHRIADVALTQLYGMQRPQHGPIPVAVEPASPSALAIDYETGGGELTLRNGVELIGFEIAEIDGEFIPAKAVITDYNTIQVSAQSVENPRYIRYGWANEPEIVLFNAAGLPAQPFRTDNRPQLSSGKFW